MREELPPEIKRLYEKWEKDKSSKIFAALANGLRKLGFYEEALNVLREGILRNPDYPEGYLVFGRINLEKGNINEGIEALQKTIELDPYNAVATRLLAEHFEQRGDLKKSLEYYKKLKNIDPFFENIDKKIEEIEKKLSIPERKIEEISVFEEKVIEKEIPSIEEMHFPPELEKIMEEETSKPFIFEEFEKEEIPPFLKEEEKVSLLDELEKEEFTYVEEVREEEKIEISEIEKAKIFEEQGFLDKALESYKKAFEKEPHNKEIEEKIKEIEGKLKKKEEIVEEIIIPEIPEEAIRVFEEIEEKIPLEDMTEEKETMKRIEYEEIPSIEEMVSEKEIKYSPHPFKLEEYKPFYEIKEEKVHEEVEELIEKMKEEKKKEEKIKEEMKKEIEIEEKMGDENYRTFLEWIEKLKK